MPLGSGWGVGVPFGFGGGVGVAVGRGVAPRLMRGKSALAGVGVKWIGCGVCPPGAGAAGEVDGVADAAGEADAGDDVDVAGDAD
ncbi:MAG TPA: hypothetical protein VN860_02525 [Candidatus Acidoferrales bacterium]|nr:hypothetical protein [Candidatus Acidoferrales bacterium]